MSHAETCPVCNGTGKLFPSQTDNGTAGETCHGCGGTGWVTVAGDGPPSPYTPSYPVPSWPYETFRQFPLYPYFFPLGTPVWC